MTHDVDTLGQLSTQNPWPGLRAFTENDRDFFHGRERETKELLGIVQRAPVVVLYGQSGLGKTSLLQAGLFPELKRLNFLPFRLRLDHSDDTPALAAQIKSALSAQLDAAGVTAPRPTPGESLWEYFHRRDVDFWGPRNRLLVPVVVLDQFEEVFTLGLKNDNTADRVTQFAAELESLLEHRPPQAVRERLETHPDEGTRFDFQRQALKLMLSLREDFLPHLDTWRTRIPSLLPNRFRLERMTGAQALEVVQRAGSDLVAPEVAHDIVEFVSSSQRRRSAHLAEQRNVEPALLSVVCDELNRRRIERGQSSITADLLTHEREGIIKSFYERAFVGLDPRVRDWAEDELLTASGYRDRAAVEDALKLGLPESAFDHLVDSRILHREEHEGVIWLELTHDLLTDPAAQSRASREKRRQEDTAIQLRRELRRSQKRTAVFAALLVVALVAFVLAFYSERKRDEALAQLASDEKMASDATKSMGLDISGDLWIPTATIVQTIDKTEKEYSGLLGQMHDTDDLKLQHAQFLARAALALFEVGHYREGVADAGKALEFLDQIKQPKALPDLDLTQAEALYAQGTGLVETGKLTDAGKDFNKALELVGPSAESGSNSQAVRIDVLSRIGLGVAERKDLSVEDAVTSDQRALDFISAKQLDDEESGRWKAMALSNIGLCQAEDEQEETWLGKALATLGGPRAINQGNLRKKKLYAEIAEQNGFTEYRLNNLDQAENLFRQAAAASEDLRRRDPDNLDWQLAFANSQYGSGMVHFDRGEWEPSEIALDQAEQIGKALNSSQPDWARAQFLWGQALFHQGNLIRTRYNNEPSDPKDPKELQRAWDKFAAARTLLERSTPLQSYDRSLIAFTILYEGFLCDSPVSISACPPRPEEKRTKAITLYQEALQVLQPVEKQKQGQFASIDAAIGDTLLEGDQFPAAISSYSAGLKIRDEVRKKSPTSQNYFNLSKAHESLGYAFAKNKDVAHGAAEYQRAAQAIETAVALRAKACPHPRCPYSISDIDLVRQKADVQAAMADLPSGQSDMAGTFEAMDRAVTTVWEALQQNYSEVALSDDLDRYRRVAKAKQEQLEQSLAKQKSGDAGEKAGPPDSNGNASPAQTAKLIQKFKDLRDRTDPVKLLGHNDQQGWIMPPMLPGSWRILSVNESKAARDQLLAVDKRLPASQKIGAIRRLPVDFYENAAIYEAQVIEGAKEIGIATYMRRGKEIKVLDGRADPIREMNRKSPPRLDTTERATAYLRFFMGSIQLANGRLMLVDQSEDLHWLPGAKAELRDEVRSKIKPLVIEALPDGSWQGIGTLQSSNGLYLASFQLSRVGFAQAKQSNALTDALPIAVEGFTHGIRAPYSEEMAAEIYRRRLVNEPKDQETLRSLVVTYNDLKQWKEAAEIEQRLVDAIKDQAKDDQERRDKLPGEYQNLSWFELLSHDFAGALASCEVGRRWNENYIPLQTNCAHALLLVGRVKDAEEIYLKYRGQKSSPNSDKVWEQTIVEDFGELKEAGIESPEMSRIAKELTPEQK